ncbi:MAG: hypothetical protein AVDCRST_MAG51-1014, partial [uncultured Ramlibacter sp.]
CPTRSLMTVPHPPRRTTSWAKRRATPEAWTACPTMSEATVRHANAAASHAQTVAPPMAKPGRARTRTRLDSSRTRTSRSLL